MYAAKEENVTHVSPCPEMCLMSVRCAGCTALALSEKTYDEVTDWFRQGIISEDALEAYRHVWTISANRSARYDHYKDEPPTAEGREIASALVAILPSGRGYC
jgi:predicted Fe-S protein YdhL (DUF1289 family)